MTLRHALYDDESLASHQVRVEAICSNSAHFDDAEFDEIFDLNVELSAQHREQYNATHTCVAECLVSASTARVTRYSDESVALFHIDLSDADDVIAFLLDDIFDDINDERSADDINDMQDNSFDVID